MKFLFIYLFVINYLAFSMFAFDKERAMKNKRRISEKNLLTLCFFGGSFGAWLAMNKLRHKTNKKSFKLWFYAIVTLQVFIFFAIYKRKLFL